jgi:hypothetical protein
MLETFSVDFRKKLAGSNGLWLISIIDLIIENFEFLPKTFGHCWKK